MGCGEEAPLGSTAEGACLELIVIGFHRLCLILQLSFSQKLHNGSVTRLEIAGDLISLTVTSSNYEVPPIFRPLVTSEFFHSSGSCQAGIS